MIVLLALHIAASLYVARWTVFWIRYTGRGSLLVELPLQVISVVCLCGLALAAGAERAHWARRHLMLLNLGAVVSLLLWALGYGDGPVYLVAASRGTGAWLELAALAVVVFGLVMGVSLGIVRRNPSREHSQIGRAFWFSGVSVIVFLAGAAPTLAVATSPLKANWGWGTPFGRLMELGTIFAIVLAAVGFLRKEPWAFCTAVLEALAIPALAFGASWLGLGVGS